MTTIVDREVPSASMPAFSATLASEWAKLRTLPFTTWMVLFALLITPTASAVFCLTSAVTAGTPFADMSATDATGTSLLGSDLAVIVLAILSASFVASEYTTGMMHVTLTATPRRWKPLAAKATVLTVTALVVGALATGAAFGVSAGIRAAQEAPAMTLADAQISRLVLGNLLMAPFYSLLAAALAFLIRNTGGAVAALLAVMSIPALVNALPSDWREILSPYVPASALHSLSGTASVTDRLAAGPAAGVLLAWAAVLLACAYVAFSRRDA